MSVFDYDPEFTLAWPRSLFEWEARRLLSVPGLDLNSAAPLLLREAFEEQDAAEQFEAGNGTAESRLLSLLADPHALREYDKPTYWAERHGDVPDAPGVSVPLAGAFVRLIEDMSWDGYFPRVMPKICVDEHYADRVGTEEAIRRATGLNLVWPIPESEWESFPRSPLYTLIEFFHDKAQRPRSPGYVHTFNGCGPHFAMWNRESGGTVYRWRVNEMLRAFREPVRLSSSRGEKGRLVRVLPNTIESVVSEQLQVRTQKDDEVAHALRDYRTRGAGRPQKVAAVALLAGELERRREILKREVLNKDESALFEIANNFAIRHRNDRQRNEYADEFLDWVFEIFVVTIVLLDSIERRSQ